MGRQNVQQGPRPWEENRCCCRRTERDPGLIPSLDVELTGNDLSGNTVDSAKDILTRLLGLDRDISGFYLLAARDPNLDKLAKKFRGVKPPRYSTLFEAVQMAIIGQQLSLFAAIKHFEPLCAKLRQGI